MKRIVIITGLAAGLCACQPQAAAPADKASGETQAPMPEPVPAPAGAWEVKLSPMLALVSGDGGLSLACEEGKRMLRLSFEPAWEKDGPFDKAAVHFGDKSFAVAIDAGAAKDELDRYRPVYLLPADADTVTAVMMANTMRLVVSNQDGEQERTAPPDDSGAFDLFATTCAQINGLR